ncbi:MAG: hypothetical protein M1834_002808 [Cirrosporium novae-zelandiae]|nr:MAG: hypothetical protein M1834_002808 [Cirrosporium novae-zelandiae]
MKATALLLYPTVLVAFAATISSQLVLPNLKAAQRLNQQHSVGVHDQSPIMEDAPNIALPPSSESDPFSRPTGDVTISDVIARERRMNIFAGFTRDIDTVSKRLNDGSQNTTVLAPLNSEMKKLERKPWEFPKDYESNFPGKNVYDIKKDGEDMAHRNLRLFVEAHIVPESPWSEGEKIKTLEGNTLWWEMKGDVKVIQPHNIEVESIASKVVNGEVWVLKGVINYS